MSFAMPLSCCFQVYKVRVRCTMDTGRCTGLHAGRLAYVYYDCRNSRQNDELLAKLLSAQSPQETHIRTNTEI